MKEFILALQILQKETTTPHLLLIKWKWLSKEAGAPDMAGLIRKSPEGILFATTHGCNKTLISTVHL